MVEIHAGTYSVVRGNVYAVAIFLVVFVGSLLPHVSMAGVSLTDVIDAPFSWNPLLVLVGFLAGIVVHEALHGVGFRYFGPNSRRRHLSETLPAASVVRL